MKSRITRSFRRGFEALPSEIQRRARRAFGRFQDNPSHPGLWFKKVHPVEPIFSVRVSQDYRAVGRLEEEEIIWFFIGDHDDYERLLRSL